MALTFPEDLAKLREHWPNATSSLMSDDVATRYAEAAEEQVSAWAPAGFDATAGNGSYVLAVAMHASDLANAAAREGDPVSPEGWPIRTRPVSDAVKVLLRPPTATPAVG